MSVASLPACDPRRAEGAFLGRGVLGIAIGLTSLGLVTIYSSTALRMSERGADMNALLARQVGWVFVAAGVAWAAATVPLQAVRRHAGRLLAAVLVLLVLVALVGRSANHSRRWLPLGPVSIQPSEFLKVAAILYLADRLARREEDARALRVPWGAVLAPLGLCVVLVMAQPDLGTSLFVAALSVVMLGLAGVRPGTLVTLTAVAIPALVTIAASRFQHVRDRLRFFSEGEHASPQLAQAVIAVGSGGWFGVGLGEGTQKLWRVAEIQTDFIFAVVGEEMGFVGCAAVVAAFMAFVVFGARIAARARAADAAFAYHVAAGATFAVAFQALVNVAVVTACAPTKGVSLPFLSLGGSHLVTAFAAVGLLVNVARTTGAPRPGTQVP